MKLNAPFDVWKKNCKRWRCNKLGHLTLSMMDIIHIDLHQEVLQMTLAVQKTIGEGELHPNSMDIDITTKGRNITVEMDTTKMQRLGYLRSSFLVSMALVILMCI